MARDNSLSVSVSFHSSFRRPDERQLIDPAAHCDSHFTEIEDGKVLRTFFTLHLYLNDSVAEVGKEAELVGGATSFVSSDAKRKINVDPKAGRVLIFQHRGLYHAGDDVVEGTKYTMRTEIMYEMVETEEAERDG